MKEIININQAKEKMKTFNVIIYGSVRNIANFFLSSFTNLDILSNLFKSSMIIIFENDSKDNTRDLLLKWKDKSQENITKHLILKNNLDKNYPKRATRLAYCRNKILNYIKKNNLNNLYEYSIHCDLDDRFWSLDFDGICNCFQYDLTKWDVMTCVSKGKNYYDYWALRLDNSWFNINIFSCEANEISYETKVSEFIELLQQNNNLIKVNSSFNGIGIYKTSVLISNSYDATYICNKCNNTKIGCKEDNDHIGLHKGICSKGGNIFINTKMNITTQPPNSFNYNKFIELYIRNAKKIQKNVTLYLLKSNIINKNGYWLEIGTKRGETTNLLSNYIEDKLISFTHNKNYTLLNENITIFNGNIENNINIFLNNYTQNKAISLLYFNINDYFLIKKILYKIYTKLDNNCVIIFYKLINYENYIVNSLKAFYEFTQEYDIDFKSIGMNDKIDFKNEILMRKTYVDTSFAFELIRNKYLQL